MRRRWIVSGIVFVAVVATLAVLMFGRAPAPIPTVVWYCSTTREIREAPGSSTRTDLVGVELVFTSATAVPSSYSGLLVRSAPTLAQRAIAWLKPSAGQWTTVGEEGPLLNATGAKESADGRSWERFDADLHFATPR